jgi:MarR family transcriptional regulator for hemolysin
MSNVTDVVDAEEPIGLFVTRTAKTLSRAFDDALDGAGGSLATWLVLSSLKGGLYRSQREIADALGVEGPTLTHHLNRMETAGLVTRTRNPENRRVHDVQLTADGEQAFVSLVGVVRDFDEQLRAGFSDRDLRTLRRLLHRLAANATATPDTHRAGDHEEERPA